ncbi:MAG: 16S rRNA (cytosine(1402)-N(4))-methyltransferase RsmH [Bacteroidetes bacterium]|nr:16S rRNA (cytosine(1402)-N(4))-methyltransferase RsmH [Bacteroidota bacterium]
MFHNSVLLEESIRALAIRPEGIYVDATYGGGGHSKAILKELQDGKLYAFDQDEDAMANKPEDDRLTLIHNNFRHLRNFLKLYKAVPVDGILADLGVSSHQIDNPERGFSTRFEGVLDMRMNRDKKMSAREVVNEYKEDKLVAIFREYGELHNAMKITRLIISGRKEKLINTTEDLKEILMPAAERGKENKFFAQVFQALRIEVNQELDALKEFLIQATDVLKQGGRLVIISYHSLEDRLVKEYFRSGKFSGNIEKDFYGNPIVPLKVLNRKPVVATKEEIALNSRARSARLRIAEKL